MDRIRVQVPPRIWRQVIGRTEAVLPLQVVGQGSTDPTLGDRETNHHVTILPMFVSYT